MRITLSVMALSVFLVLSGCAGTRDWWNKQTGKTDGAASTSTTNRPAAADPYYSGSTPNGSAGTGMHTGAQKNKSGKSDGSGTSPQY